ncbi:SDR family oxidoreductase [Streptosporangium sp. NPDC002524]|uniref:SDR family oxidoreductase n=1 Tax=Streptosporangium sp. NPDC002524 TaxID=3154537 RepID=UPI00331F82F0
MGTRALEGKVALVTGGSRGIGRAIAERLGRDGATVAVAYARDETAAHDTVERIREGGGRAFALRAELGRHGDAASLWAAFDAESAKSTESAKSARGTGSTGTPGNSENSGNPESAGDSGSAPDGTVDIIVNNAGIGSGSDLAGLTEEAFDEVFAVNVRAPFFVVREGLRRLRDGGRIINISSGAARLAMPGIIAYGATKGALDTFTLNLAKELGPRGITANSVAPGIIDTDVNADWLRGDPQAEAHAASVAALGRVGQPEDVADIVAFLASDDARWVTGRVIDATGGSGL